MKSVIFLLFIIYVCEGVKLPSYFQKCSRHDPKFNDCLTEKAKIIWPKLSQGEESIHFHSAEPLMVPNIYVDVKGNLQLNMSNTSIHGLSNIDIKSIKMDLEKQTINATYFMKQVSTRGPYTINGHILLIPIVGSGVSNFTYDDGIYYLFLKYKLFEKNHKTYMTIIDSDMPYKIKRAHYVMEDLFSGNRQLAEVMKQVLDDNWKEVNEEVGPSIGLAISRVLAAALSSMFERVPFDEFFLD